MHVLRSKSQPEKQLYLAVKGIIMAGKKSKWGKELWLKS
jgi:hypothetical protein